VLHALIGYVPSNYKWLARLLGFRGTIAQGLGELRALHDAAGRRPADAYLLDEAAILRLFLEFHLLPGQEPAAGLAARLESGRPGPLHLFSLLSYYLASANNEKALALLEDRRPAPGEFPFRYLEFMHGLALLNKLDAGAAVHFRSYLAGYGGDSFVKSACQKLAWLALLEDDTAGYRAWLAEALRRGDDFTDEDKHALAEAKKNAPPNVYLLRARLLFDGGYYRQSLAELAGRPLDLFPTFADRLEFTYRLARIYDKLGMTEQAGKHYEQTVRNGEAHAYYFAANAALHLGRLHENAGRRDEAIRWFRRCLSMRHHEYQDSIDQRAEAGLNRLGAQE
jgi:tetratricopeptide (TPR) repeat protein